MPVDAGKYYYICLSNPAEEEGGYELVWDYRVLHQSRYTVITPSVVNKT